MSIRYSTNWMGPINLQWFLDRGYAHKETKVLEEDFIWSDKKAGDTIEVTIIDEHYSAGRIDVYGEEEYPDEIDLPPMRSEDWNTFSEWLETFETDFAWSLEELVWFYEKYNPKIRWHIE